MSSRRESRECALKLLYQIDLKFAFTAYESDLNKALDSLWLENELDDDGKNFAKALVEGAISNLSKIDDLISRHSTNWKIGRMAYVDRNVMRIAVFELLFLQDVPVKVAINEAVDIAKAYGDSQSGAFVNGILDNIAKEIGREE